MVSYGIPQPPQGCDTVSLYSFLLLVLLSASLKDPAYIKAMLTSPDPKSLAPGFLYPALGHADVSCFVERQVTPSTVELFHTCSG